MDVNRLDRGMQIFGGAGLLLFVSLFLPWYGVSASLGSGFGKISVSASAWQAFSFIDILLFLAAAIAVAIAVAVGMAKLPELPLPLGQLMLGVAAVAALLVLFRLMFIPGGEGVGIVHVGRRVGVFVALIAAAGMVYGAAKVEGVPVTTV
jgi:hypothetical protein